MRVLLIRKDFKHTDNDTDVEEFESLVNTEGFQTLKSWFSLLLLFESLVNTEGFQTARYGCIIRYGFESLVNTEGFQT